MEDIQILIVDDEPDIRQLLRILLENQGYQISETASGDEAVQRLRDFAGFDLVIMDIMMPGMDGISACQAIRRFSTAPILFLTAKAQLGDMSSAYTSGGDDFLPKPFSQAELLLKVDSLLRRYRMYKGKPEQYQDDPIHLDETRRCVVKNGVAIELTVKEYEILRFFFRNKGKPLDVRALYEGAWGDSFMPASNNTVMVHILNLRKKLEDDPANPTLIRTVWGKGYQFG